MDVLREEKAWIRYYSEKLVKNFGKLWGYCPTEINIFGGVIFLSKMVDPNGFEPVTY